MRRVATLLFSLALVITSLACSANVKPNGLFVDGAVLQQGMVVPVWGTADNDEQINFTLNGYKANTVAKDGKWMLRLPPMKAGGPYTMTISGKNTIELKNVYVGEVWLCSGQSNMGFALQRADTGKEAIAASKDPLLHLVTIPARTVPEPMSDIDSMEWKESSPESTPDFSAIAYFFGRDLRKALKVPVGLIDCSYGGTRVEAWTSKEALDPDPGYAESMKIYNERQLKNNQQCGIYNGMVAPIIPYAIRGFIWYQGESNANRAFLYRTHFPTLIRNWRKDWNQGDFPFIFVQLPGFGKAVDEPADSHWAELREAQLMTLSKCPNTAMAVSIEFGQSDNIHPTKKEPVSARIALAARAIAYKEKIPYQGPIFKSLQVKDKQAIVTFTNTEGALVAKGGKLTGFTVCGEDKKFYDADATIKGDTVIVTNPKVEHPVAVRYGWANFPTVNLYNKVDLPASPFRTDDFPMLTAGNGYFKEN